MENTQILSSNGSLCMTMNGKNYDTNKSQNEKSMFNNHVHTKQLITGSMYTACSQSISKSHINSSTQLNYYEFHQIRTTSSIANSMRNLSVMPPKAIYLQESGKLSTDKILSTMISKTDAINGNANGTGDAAYDEPAKTSIIDACDHSKNNANDGNVIVNAMRNWLGFLIKPILDTKTKIIGADKSKMIYEPQTVTTKMGNSCDHHRNQFGSLSDMFFDCDDFLDGSEDTVDFVADSTKIQWNSMSSSDSIYFECNPNLKMDEEAHNQKTSPHPLILAEKVEAIAHKLDSSNIPIAIETGISLGKSQPTTAIEPVNDVKRCEALNSIKDKSTMMADTLQPSCLSRNSVKRKRRREMVKPGSKRAEFSHKHLSANKNRHEKNRHYLELDMLDDYSMYSVSGDDSDNYVAEDGSNASDSDNGGDDDRIDISDDLVIVEPSKSQHPISPEEIPSGCIFKYFYQLASPLLTTIPAHLLARLTATPAKTTQHEQSCSLIHASDADSDDSFITFDDSCNDDTVLKMVPRNASRKRQPSECSDDFIVFCDDSIDGNGSCHETYDDDYTESSDDSCDEDDEDFNDDDDGDSDFDCNDENIEVLEGNHKAHCLLNKKKVRFNLRPEVHLMRTWKYAYSQARKSQFLHFQLDKERFEKRIRETGQILLPILACDHRQKIFSERFE